MPTAATNNSDTCGCSHVHARPVNTHAPKDATIATSHGFIVRSPAFRKSGICRLLLLYKIRGKDEGAKNAAAVQDRRAARVPRYARFNKSKKYFNGPL